MPLSDAQIRGAKPQGERTVKLSDGGGLQLWITPSGGRLWNVAYRHEGSQQKLSLGPYPAVTLKPAREHRDAAKALLASGLNPGHQRKLQAVAKANTAANTFGVIADELIAKKRAEGLAETTLSKVAWLVDFARPTLGARPIAEIKAPDVLVVLRAVEARGRHETSKRLRSTIGEVFRYAIATARATDDLVFEPSKKREEDLVGTGFRCLSVEARQPRPIESEHAGLPSQPRLRADGGIVALHHPKHPDIGSGGAPSSALGGSR